MAEANHPYQWQGDDLILVCHLQPGAKDDAFIGLHGDALKIRISAPPVEGKANRHLLKSLAASFGVRQRDVTLLAGDSSRQKRLRICSPQRFPTVPGVTFTDKNPQN